MNDRPQLPDIDDPPAPPPAPALPPTAATPMAMLQNAISHGAGVEVLEKLLTLQERYERNESRRAFDRAMAEVRARLPAITKTKRVDFTSQKGRTSYAYEDLSTVVEALAPALAEVGLSFRWRTDNSDASRVIVTCIIAHRDGWFEENSLAAPLDNSGNKNPLQQIGSAVTYLQRYTLKAALGVAAADDDDGGRAVTAAPRTLAPGQVEHFKKALSEAGGDETAFLGWLGVTDWASIPASAVPKITMAIAKKREEAKKKAAEQPANAPPKFNPEVFLKHIDKDLGQLTADGDPDEAIAHIKAVEEIIAEKHESGDLFPPDHAAALTIIAKHKDLLGL